MTKLRECNLRLQDNALYVSDISKIISRTIIELELYATRTMRDPDGRPQPTNTLAKVFLLPTTELGTTTFIEEAISKLGRRGAERLTVQSARAPSYDIVMKSTPEMRERTAVRLTTVAKSAIEALRARFPPDSLLDAFQIFDPQFDSSDPAAKEHCKVLAEHYYPEQVEQFYEQWLSLNTAKESVERNKKAQIEAIKVLKKVTGAEDELRTLLARRKKLWQLVWKDPAAVPDGVELAMRVAKISLVIVGNAAVVERLFALTRVRKRKAAGKIPGNMGDYLICHGGPDASTLKWWDGHRNAKKRCFHRVVTEVVARHLKKMKQCSLGQSTRSLSSAIKRRSQESTVADLLRKQRSDKGGTHKRPKPNPEQTVENTRYNSDLRFAQEQDEAPLTELGGLEQPGMSIEEWMRATAGEDDDVDGVVDLESEDRARTPEPAPATPELELDLPERADRCVHGYEFGLCIDPSCGHFTVPL
jgi:hypothetical protein